MNLDFKKINKDETEEHFLWRIGQAYDHGQIDGNWQDICVVMNREFREDESDYYGESAYRKAYQQAKRFYDAGVFAERDRNYLAELTAAKHEIRKEKQKLFDERTALNKVLREEARRESLYDIVKRAIEDYQPARFEYTPQIYRGAGVHDLIIQCTDLHVGMNIDSPFNTYNTAELQRRIYNYLDNIFEIKERYGAENAYVVLGGDMIHGLIHLNARLEQKEGVVQQIMNASDIISQFVYELSKRFKYVEVHTTAGNHARTHENKADVKHGDNFDLLVSFNCKRALSNVQNVTFCDNYLDYDIATFEVRGHMVYAVHGDKDSLNNIVHHMMDFARKADLRLPDIIIVGHYHTSGFKDIQGVKVAFSGSMCGMDQHAVDSRLTGSPEQLVIVVDEDRVAKSICDIPVANKQEIER